jgi:ATP-dependent protease ClpP protease subunit
MLVEATHQSPERVRRDLEGGAVLFADEARDYGIIDAIVEQGSRRE